MFRLALTATIIALTAPATAYAACLPAALCTKVSGLADAPLGVWGGTGDLTTNYTMCVYVQNDDESNYVITGTGDGVGNAYIVTNGTSDITFTVEYEESGAGGWKDLLATTNSNFPNPHTTDEDCVGGGGDSAKIQVTVPEANMDFATSGAYSGTVTLVTSPD